MVYVIRTNFLLTLNFELVENKKQKTRTSLLSAAHRCRLNVYFKSKMAEVYSYSSQKRLMVANNCIKAQAPS